MIIGIAGLVGSGKTTVGIYLGKRGFKLISGDKVASDLRRDKVVISKLIRICGKSIRRGRGIDRRKLMHVIAFSQKRDEINKLMFPLIKDTIKKRIEKYIRSGCTDIVVEAPCFFEMGIDSLVDTVIWLDTPATIRANRISKKMIPEIYIGLNGIQSNSARPGKADYILLNDSSIRNLELNVDKLLKSIEDSR